VNLAAAGGIIILGIVCPPAGIAAGVAYGTMQVTEATTGTSLISGRKLSTEERVTEGVFGMLDAVPGLKAAGAFGAIGSAGSKSMTKIGELSKALGQSSSRRFTDLRTAGRSSLNKVRTAAGERVANVKQSAEDFADRLSLGGMQPAMAGGYGSSADRVSARAEDTVQQIISKESNNIEKVRGVEKLNRTSSGIEIGKGDLARLRKKLMVPERNTVAIGKARIEGIDEVIELSGASPRVRQDAKLPSLDVIAPNRDIKAPTTVAMNKNHAEEEVFYHFDERIKLEGISPNKVKGELYLHQSNKAGVCPTCLQGIKNLNKAPGIFKQFSDKYPNLKVVVTSEGSEGVKAFGRQHFILKAGKYME
jgi:hypothetical protein